jgi:predicted CopG family antitoxin
MKLVRIRVSTETKRKLEKLKSGDENYDDLLNALIASRQLTKALN